MRTHDLALKKAVIDVYRDELRKRYELESIRKYTVADTIPDPTLVALRHFFLEHIYPAPKSRERLDLACDRVGQIFRSPRRLMPLLGLAFGSLWRLGLMIPQAAKVTATTLESFLETRRLENDLSEYALKRGFQPKDLKRIECIAEMVAKIPEREMIRFRNDVLRLFRSLGNARLIEAGVAIMTRAIDMMESRGDTYDEMDVDGFRLGKQLLEGSLELFHILREGEADLIVDVIEEIEIDWYERMKGIAAGTTAV